MNNSDPSSAEVIKKTQSFQLRRYCSLLALLLSALGVCFSLLNNEFLLLDNRTGWIVGLTVSLLNMSAYAFLYRCTWCGKFPETEDYLPSFNPDICDHCLSPLKTPKYEK